jgi:hypothetical protein
MALTEAASRHCMFVRSRLGRERRRFDEADADTTMQEGRRWSRSSQKRRADNDMRDHDMQWDFWTLRRG